MAEQMKVRFINYSQVRKFLAPLVVFRTALERDRPLMTEHEKCAAYLSETLASLGLLVQRLSVPNMLPSLERQAWQNFCRTHGISEQALLSSVWGARGATAAEADTTLIFLSHYDVVDAVNDTWQTDPFQLVEDRDGNCYGRGTMDMKGGLAAKLAAIEVFNHDLKPGARLACLATPLEEKDGAFGAKAALDFLIATGEIKPAKTNLVVVGEATGFNVLTARRAGYQYEIALPLAELDVAGTTDVQFSGNPAHAGSFDIFAYRRGEADHVLYDMATAFAAGRLTGKPIGFAVGLPSSAGIVPHAYNVIPSLGRLTLATDGRRSAILEKILLFLHEIARRADWREDEPTAKGVSLNSYFVPKDDGQLLVGTNIRIFATDALAIEKLFSQAAVKTGLPVGTFVQKKEKFDQRGSELSHVTGHIVEQITGFLPDVNFMGIGCSDGQFAAGHGLQVVEVGPIGVGEHGNNERVTTNSLGQLASVYLALMEHYLFKI